MKFRRIRARAVTTDYDTDEDAEDKAQGEGSRGRRIGNHIFIR